MKTFLQIGATVLLVALSQLTQAAEPPIVRADSGYEQTFEAVPWGQSVWCDRAAGDDYDFHAEHRTLRAGDSLAWSCKNRFGVVGLARATDGHSVRIESEIHAYFPDTTEAGAIRQLYEACSQFDGLFRMPTPGHLRCEFKTGTLDVAITSWEGKRRVQIDMVGIGVWQ